MVLNALHPENIGAMAEKMNALRPGSALAVKADVSDSREAERLFDEAEAAFGPVDILINNAAVSLIKLFQDITDDEWRYVFGAGIDSAFYCSRRAAKGMIRRQGGVILNVSSMWGTAPAPARWPIRRPKGRSSPSPRRWPKSWAPPASGSTASPPASS